MHRTYQLLLISLALCAAQAAAAVDAPLQNELKNHPAPYLALHGDDPVAWLSEGSAINP